MNPNHELFLGLLTTRDPKLFRKLKNLHVEESMDFEAYVKKLDKEIGKKETNQYLFVLINERFRPTEDVRQKMLKVFKDRL